MSQFFDSVVDDELLQPVPNGVVVAVRIYSPTGGHWELVQVAGNLIENMPPRRRPPDWGSLVGWHFVRFLDSQGEYRDSPASKSLMYFSPRRYQKFWVPVELHPRREVPTLYKFDGLYLDLTNSYQTTLRPELGGVNLLERVVAKLGKPAGTSWEEWLENQDYDEWNDTEFLHDEYATTYRSICEKITSITTGRAYTVSVSCMFYNG